MTTDGGLFSRYVKASGSPTAGLGVDAERQGDRRGCEEAVGMLWQASSVLIDFKGASSDIIFQLCTPKFCSPSEAGALAENFMMEHFDALSLIGKTKPITIEVTEGVSPMSRSSWAVCGLATLLIICSGIEGLTGYSTPLSLKQSFVDLGPSKDDHLAIHCLRAACQYLIILYHY